MIELKSRGELDVMREAGRITAAALSAVREHAAVGVRLSELDEVARAVIAECGAAPVFDGYHPNWAPSPFPGAICASVNDAIVHGIPGDQRLARGDLLSVDCGARLDGWCGDAAITFPVGEADPADEQLVRATTAALEDGIAAAQPGGRLGDVSAAIGVLGRGGGYGLPGPLGGHGVGRDMHEAPFVPNEGKPGRGVPLRPGLVLALEPMLLAGGRDDIDTGDDGWTVRTGDGSRAAHVEHTVAITADGPVVLTAA